MWHPWAPQSGPGWLAFPGPSPELHQRLFQYIPGTSRHMMWWHLRWPRFSARTSLACWACTAGICSGLWRVQAAHQHRCRPLDWTGEGGAVSTCPTYSGKQKACPPCVEKDGWVGHRIGGWCLSFEVVCGIIPQAASRFPFGPVHTCQDEKSHVRSNLQGIHITLSWHWTPPV